MRAIVVKPPRRHLPQQVATRHQAEEAARPRVLALPALRVDERTDQLQAGVPWGRAQAIVTGVGMAVPAQATAALRAVQQRRVVLAATPTPSDCVRDDTARVNSQHAGEVKSSRTKRTRSVVVPMSCACSASICGCEQSSSAPSS